MSEHGYVGRALVRAPRASAFSLPTNFIPTPPGWERDSIGSTRAGLAVRWVASVLEVTWGDEWPC